jgi:hypothetical protein
MAEFSDWQKRSAVTQALERIRTRIDGEQRQIALIVDNHASPVAVDRFLGAEAVEAIAQPAHLAAELEAALQPGTGFSTSRALTKLLRDDLSDRQHTRLTQALAGWEHAGDAEPKVSIKAKRHQHVPNRSAVECRPADQPEANWETVYFGGTQRGARAWIEDRLEPHGVKLSFKGDRHADIFTHDMVPTGKRMILQTRFMDVDTESKATLLAKRIEAADVPDDFQQATVRFAGPSGPPPKFLVRRDSDPTRLIKTIEALAGRAITTITLHSGMI